MCADTIDEASSNGTCHRPGDEASSNGTCHRPGDEASSNGTCHLPGDEASSNGTYHRPGDEASSNGTCHLPGDEASSNGACHRPGDEASSNGACHQPADAEPIGLKVCSDKQFRLAVFLRTPTAGGIQADSCQITDENVDGDGAIAVNSDNGELSVVEDNGEEFDCKQLKDRKEEEVIIYTFESSSGRFLALDTRHDDDKVRALTSLGRSYRELILALKRKRFTWLLDGMPTIKKSTEGEMRFVKDSNRHWRRIPFKYIGNSPTGSGYFALKYWGDHFGKPPTANSVGYFMVAKTKNDFEVAREDVAAEFGRFGFKEN